MKHLTFDLMKPIGGGSETFIATLRGYEYDPIFKFDFKKLYKWIIEKRPTLKSRPFNAYPEKPIELGGDAKLEVVHFNQDINKIIRQAR